MKGGMEGHLCLLKMTTVKIKETKNKEEDRILDL